MFLIDIDYLYKVIINILEGAKITLLVFVVTLLFSIPLGLVGASLKKIDIRPFKKTKYRIKNFNPLKFILDIYTWVIRGTPLLLQLFFVLYGLPIMFKSMFSFGRLEAALITFVINYTAYFIEIFRGGMNSINKGQFEACQVLGLSRYNMYRKIILPQTFKKVIPSITNESINLIKDTALVASVAISDILKNTKEIVNHDFRFDAYFVAGLLYLILSYGIVFIFKKIEKKYSFYN